MASKWALSGTLCTLALPPPHTRSPALLPPPPQARHSQLPPTLPCAPPGAISERPPFAAATQPPRASKRSQVRTGEGRSSAAARCRGAADAPPARSTPDSPVKGSGKVACKHSGCDALRTAQPRQAGALNTTARHRGLCSQRSHVSTQPPSPSSPQAPGRHQRPWQQHTRLSTSPGSPGRSVRPPPCPQHPVSLPSRRRTAAARKDHTGRGSSASLPGGAAKAKPSLP